MRYGFSGPGWGLCALALCAAIWPDEAGASTWVDPSFDAMIDEAQIIAVATVTGGGVEYSRVTLSQILKGNPPGNDIVVTGFNDLWLPAEGVKKNAFVKGEEYLLFLTRRELGAARSARFVSWTPAGTSDVPVEWTKLPLFDTPTPTSGEYRVKNGVVHARWNRVNYSRTAPGAPVTIVLPLVHALAHPDDEQLVQTACALLPQHLTVAAARTGDSTWTPALTTLEWLLGGQTLCGRTETEAAVLQAARHPHPSIQAAAALALASLPFTESVARHLDGLLGATSENRAADSTVQRAATQALIELDPMGERAAEMLARALPGSSPHHSFDELTSPILNRYGSGREAMARALFNYRGQAAVPVFLAALRDPATDSGTMAVLLEFFATHKHPEARTLIYRRFAREGKLDSAYTVYFLKDGDDEVLDKLFAFVVRDGHDMLSTFEFVQSYALGARRGDPRLVATVIRLLDIYGKRDDVLFVLPMSIPAATPEVDAAVAAIDPTALDKSVRVTLATIRAARSLQAEPPADIDDRIAAWLALVAQDHLLGYSLDYLLREALCATPPAGYASLAIGLEQLGMPHREGDIVAALSRAVQTGRPPELFPERCALKDEAPVEEQPAEEFVPEMPFRPTTVRGGCGAGCTTSARASDPLWPLLFVALWLVRRRGRSASGL